MTPYRNGYNDFDPNTNAHDLCPYKSYTDITEYLEGWQDAFEDHAVYKQQKREERGALYREWLNSSYKCPWNEPATNGMAYCMANDRPCKLSNCTPWLFIKGES